MSRKWHHYYGANTIMHIGGVHSEIAAAFHQAEARYSQQEYDRQRQQGRKRYLDRLDELKREEYARREASREEYARHKASRRRP